VNIPDLQVDFVRIIADGDYVLDVLQDVPLHLCQPG
jgi:hypothetical protein